MTENIILLFGGESDERRVSVASAQNILSALPEAIPWFVNPAGVPFICSRAEILAFERPFEREFTPESQPAYDRLETALNDPTLRSRVFLLAFHGGVTENGSLQKVLEAAGVAFTGSGSVASYQAFDKILAKKIVGAAGLKLAPALEFSAQTLLSQPGELREFLRREKEIICKPVEAGSSFGLYRIKDTPNDESAFSDAVHGIGHSPYARYLAEKFISGRELTVGVFQRGTELVALPPSEVRTQAGKNFDYEGKYLGKGSLEITPADLTPSEAAAAKDLAQKAHIALGCEGYSRTDMILAPDGLVFIETNTLPGLSKASFIPQQLAAAKIPFETFLRAIITDAILRREIALNTTPRSTTVKA